MDDQEDQWQRVHAALAKLRDDQLRREEFEDAHISMETAVRVSAYAELRFGIASEAANNFDEIEVYDLDFSDFSIGEKPQDGFALRHVEVIMDGLAKTLDDEDLMHELFDALRIELRIDGAVLELSDFEDAGGELIEPA